MFCNSLLFGFFIFGLDLNNEIGRRNFARAVSVDTIAAINVLSRIAAYMYQNSKFQAGSFVLEADWVPNPISFTSLEFKHGRVYCC